MSKFVDILLRKMSLPRNGRRSAMRPIDVMLRRQGRVRANDNGNTDISFMGLRLVRVNVHLVVPSVSEWLVKMIIHLHKAESHNSIYPSNLRTNTRNTAILQSFPAQNVHRKKGYTRKRNTRGELESMKHMMLFTTTGSAPSCGVR